MKQESTLMNHSKPRASEELLSDEFRVTPQKSPEFEMKSTFNVPHLRSFGAVYLSESDPSDVVQHGNALDSDSKARHGDNIAVALFANVSDPKNAKVAVDAINLRSFIGSESHDIDLVTNEMNFFTTKQHEYRSFDDSGPIGTCLIVNCSHSSWSQNMSFSFRIFFSYFWDIDVALIHNVCGDKRNFSP